MQFTAEGLLRLANILRELEARGEEVTAPEGFLSVLRRIADQRLLPELVLKFSGYPRVLARVASYPIEEQQSLLADPERQEKLMQPQSRHSLENTDKKVQPLEPVPSSLQEQSAVSRKEENPLPMGKSKEVPKSPLVVPSEETTAKEMAEKILAMILKHPRASLVWKALYRLVDGRWDNK
jgi:hypothetical protein